MEWQELITLLAEARGIRFEEGLSDDETHRVECTYGFHFPPDLAAFLQTALPVSEGFPNWRGEPAELLRKRLDIPLDGILFDVEYNDFWLPEWGVRPDHLDEAQALVRELVNQAPRLIPVFLHRMLPDRPQAAGNPVFSVHQTDIIYYGTDLQDYLVHEFLNATHAGLRSPAVPRAIEFWDIERFLDVRWGNGPVIFDNRNGQLP